MNIFSDITQTIGNTPLVQLNKAGLKFSGLLLAKLEYFNPMGSLKDRIAVKMIDEAESKGLLSKGGTIVEPTSGNTGIGLALVSAARGYRLILTMPESMTIERRKILKHLGAELVLTPSDRRMEGAVEKAKEIVANTQNAYMPSQFSNSVNLAIHRETTAQEIWNDTNGKVDIFVAGIGTGGSLCGVAQGLKEKNPDVYVVGVEPSNSSVIAGGRPGRHLIQGIGAGFVPDIYDETVVDELMSVSDDDAINYTRKLAQQEGIFAGVSSGANLSAALEIGKRPENEGKTIVFLCADTGERYCSTGLCLD
ncbi:MAG: cysteine synthase A [Acidobacteria bacterium]|nr:MAG: cysteine synthase A [Acidobacteriota bacterium]